LRGTGGADIKKERTPKIKSLRVKKGKAPNSKRSLQERSPAKGLGTSMKGKGKDYKLWGKYRGRHVVSE